MSHNAIGRTTRTKRQPDERSEQKQNNRKTNKWINFGQIYVGPPRIHVHISIRARWIRVSSTFPKYTVNIYIHNTYDLCVVDELSTVFIMYMARYSSPPSFTYSRCSCLRKCNKSRNNWKVFVLSCPKAWDKAVGSKFSVKRWARRSRHAALHYQVLKISVMNVLQNNPELKCLSNKSNVASNLYRVGWYMYTMNINSCVWRQRVIWSTRMCHSPLLCALPYQWPIVTLASLATRKHINVHTKQIKRQSVRNSFCFICNPNAFKCSSVNVLWTVC